MFNIVIKITKCSSPIYWYSQLVGETILIPKIYTLNSKELKMQVDRVNLPSRLQKKIEKNFYRGYIDDGDYKVIKHEEEHFQILLEEIYDEKKTKNGK